MENGIALKNIGILLFFFCKNIILFPLIKFLLKLELVCESVTAHPSSPKKGQKTKPEPKLEQI